jgi:hypothetical protein
MFGPAGQSSLIHQPIFLGGRELQCPPRGGTMSESSHSRRDFIAATSIGLLGAAAFPKTQAPQNPAEPTAGAPPAFGAGPAFGPEVSTNTFAEAEKLVQFPLQPDERAMAAESWRKTLASVYERRVGPRKVAIESNIAPYSQWHSALPGQAAGPAQEKFVRSNADPGPLPEKEEDIAYAPVTKLSKWIEQRKLTSERLTQIYLRRIERFDSKLRCIITRHRNRCWKISRAASRDSLGRKGFARYGGHSDNLWRGTVSESRSLGGCCSCETSS